MKQISEFVFDLILIGLFCTAVTLSFMHFKSLSVSYQCIKKAVVQNEVLYETCSLYEKDSVKKPDIVSKKDIIITLVSGFSYDVEIDGNLYQADTFDYATFNFSSLSEFYKKYYRYDENGKIINICYIKMEDQK